MKQVRILACCDTQEFSDYSLFYLSSVQPKIFLSGTILLNENNLFDSHLSGAMLSANVLLGEQRMVGAHSLSSFKSGCKDFFHN